MSMPSTVTLFDFGDVLDADDFYDSDPEPLTAATASDPASDTVQFMRLVRSAEDGDLEALEAIRQRHGFAPYWSEVAIAAMETGHFEFWRAYVDLTRLGLVFPVIDASSWWVRFARDLVFRDVVAARLGDNAVDLLRIVAEDVYPMLPTEAEVTANPDLWAAAEHALVDDEDAQRIWTEGRYDLDAPEMSVATLYAINSENVPLLELLVVEWRFRCSYEHLMRAARTYNQSVYNRVLKSAVPDLRPQSLPVFLLNCVANIFCCGIDLPFLDNRLLYLPPPCLPQPSPPHDGDIIWKVLRAIDRKEADPLVRFLTQYPASLHALPSLSAFLEDFLYDQDCSLFLTSANWLQCFLMHNRLDPLLFTRASLQVCKRLIDMAPSVWNVEVVPRPLDFHSDPIHIRVLPGYYRKERQRPESERDWRYYRHH